MILTSLVARLRGLVTDLNWLADTDHGELRLAPEASSVHELPGAEPEGWQPQSQARQVELRLEVSGDLADAHLDRLRMRQALGYILGNAIPCTEAAGNILIRADRENGGALVISVADDGTGIESTGLPHVLDRFRRTDQSCSRGLGGTGLGPAISRAIIESHGGHNSSCKRWS